MQDLEWDLEQRFEKYPSGVTVISRNGRRVEGRFFVQVPRLGWDTSSCRGVFQRGEGVKCVCFSGLVLRSGPT